MKISSPSCRGSSAAAAGSLSTSTGSSTVTSSRSSSQQLLQCLDIKYYFKSFNFLPYQPEHNPQHFSSSSYWATSPVMIFTQGWN